MFCRARYGEVGGVPQWAHAEASLPPEVPEYGGGREREGGDDPELSWKCASKVTMKLLLKYKKVSTRSGMLAYICNHSTWDVGGLNYLRSVSKDDHSYISNTNTQHPGLSTSQVTFPFL